MTAPQDAASDADALDSIAKVLQNPTFGPGMLEDIEQFVAATGRDTTGDNTTTWERH